MMDKVAILAASTANPSMTIRQGSDIVKTYGRSDVSISVLYSLVMQTVFTSHMLLASVLVTCRSLALCSFLASRSLVFRAVAFPDRAVRTLWNSKTARRMRKKIEYEFWTFILGPGGNALFLMLFWPGWLLLGIAGWSLMAYLR
ncbi:hypothetical protein NKR23_g6841 [Pleurostoma richardsiae]|uniref:Uncharacterized protein n=1 Tax=Pleurostoma richardsiae TaxID=41990 RepID=A0AA38RD24_9PEZI|nr:hypothetical protein NKR23_g6841 [Pleurostoma richardsiae]